MTIKELENKIKELQKELDHLKHNETKGKFKPNKNEIYYFVGPVLDVDFYNFNGYEFDNKCVNLGNCFKTEEEARFIADKIKYTLMFKNYIEEHNEPLDWENDDQEKWHIYYNYEKNYIYYCPDCSYKSQGVIYASSEQILRDAVAYVGEENVKKYILGV